MPLGGLDHVTVLSDDLEATRAFYCNVLGLTEGRRPDLGFPGYWLYCEGRAVVHLVDREGQLAENRRGDYSPGGAALDHVAFHGRDASEVVSRLRAHHIAYRENHIAEIGLRQLFVRDPNGIMIEMNFRN
jgi:catechol 2,3-dioxygenase-like lactoylglutathione lyase family enzyme